MPDKHQRGIPRATVSLAVEFDHRVFLSIVSRFGVETWNRWIQALLDGDLAASVWLSGDQPPPVSIHFRFTEDLRSRWPKADFTPVWFIADEGKGEVQEGMPEIFAMPSEEFSSVADISFMVNRNV